MRLECQTAQSKENKKASRHKIQRKWIWIVSCDFAILFFAKRHKVRENKKTSRHTIIKEIHRNIFQGHSHVGRRCDSEKTGLESHSTDLHVDGVLYNANVGYKYLF